MIHGPASLLIATVVLQATSLIHSGNLKVLSWKPRANTSEAIAESLRKTIEKWTPHIQSPTVVTAANEKKAIEQILQWPRFGCYGHRINLMVKKATSTSTSCVPEISKLLGKGRRLVTFFHQSTSASDILHTKQTQQFAPEDPRRTHNLIQDVPTRWNSLFDMLQRLVEQTPVLMAMATDNELSKTIQSTLKACVFSFEEQLIAEKVCSVLEPFYKATVSVCAENTPSLHKVILIIKKLEKSLQEDLDVPPAIRKMKSIMSEDLQARQADTDDEMLLLSILLNPYTKHLKFLESEIKDKARDMLIDKVESVIDVDVTAAHPQQKLTKTCPDIDDWMLDIENSDLDSCTDTASVITAKEVDRYLSATISGNETILKWWKENERFHPHIACLAKKFLAIPASSVPSERVFSFTGNLVNKKQARLSPNTVNTFVFLNKNMKYYW